MVRRAARFSSLRSFSAIARTPVVPRGAAGHATSTDRSWKGAAKWRGGRLDMAVAAGVLMRKSIESTRRLPADADSMHFLSRPHHAPKS